jgi:hypothetical protein
MLDMAMVYREAFDRHPPMSISTEPTQRDYRLAPV